MPSFRKEKGDLFYLEHLHITLFPPTERVFFPARAKATKGRNCARPVPRDLEMHSLKSGPSHPTTSIAEQRRLLSRRQSSPRTTFLISLSRVARKNKDGVGEEELAFQENGQRGIRRKVFAPTANFCFSFLLARFGRRVIKVIRRTLKPRGRPFFGSSPIRAGSSFWQLSGFWIFLRGK